MSDIKVIDGLEPWEVMRRASEGEKWCARVDSCDEWLESADQSHVCLLETMLSIDVAIIDTTTPEIDWDGFDWAFFGEYGGLRINGNRLAFDSADFQWITAELRESPFYYWPGGEQPVPDNVEVEVVLRDGSIHAFKLTGRVL